MEGVKSEKHFIVSVPCFMFEKCQTFVFTPGTYNPLTGDLVTAGSVSAMKLHKIDDTEYIQESFIDPFCKKKISENKLKVTYCFHKERFCL